MAVGSRVCKASTGLRQAMASAYRVRKTEIVALVLILAVAGILRLWRLDDPFVLVSDYDEGVCSLAARFIASGEMPYRDFLFAQPPTYSALLASAYKAFGHSVLVGRFLSVILSFVLVVLAYAAGRRMFNPTIGVVFAGICAVSPDFVYYGRRAVQEPLALVFMFASLVITAGCLNRCGWRGYAVAGVFLGMMAATKYTFVPAAAGIVVASALVGGGRRWHELRSVMNSRYWFIYGCFVLLAFTLILVLRWVVDVQVPIPILHPLYGTPAHFSVVILVFVVPLVLTAMVTRTAGGVAEWMAAALTSTSFRICAWCVLGSVVGFLVVTGPFIAAAPFEFVRQTVLIHVDRPLVAVPSYVELLRTLPFRDELLRLFAIPMVLSLPLVAVLLRQRTAGGGFVFLGVALAVSLLFCQGWQPIPRFYVSTLPFFLLGLSTMGGSLAGRHPHLSCPRTLGMATVFAFSFGMSLILVANYSSYDGGEGTAQRIEIEANREAVQILESLDARKTYATSPSMVAMSESLRSTRYFDTRALLDLEGLPPEQVVDMLIADGVEYAVVGSSVDYSTRLFDNEGLRSLAEELRGHARLVAEVRPETESALEIYSFSLAAGDLFNGGFEHWTGVHSGNLRPLGWDVISSGADDDDTVVQPSASHGAGGLSLVVCEGGDETTTTGSYAGVAQRIAFPHYPLQMTFSTSSATQSVGAEPQGPSVHVVDNEGHRLIIGFSDTEDSVLFDPCSDCGFSLVMLPVELSRTQSVEVTVSRYWLESGWAVPEYVNLLLTLSATSDRPGCQALLVDSISIGEP